MLLKKKPPKIAAINPDKNSVFIGAMASLLSFFSLIKINTLSDKLIVTMSGRASRGERKNIVINGIAKSAVPKPVMPFIKEENKMISPMMKTTSNDKLISPI